MNKRIEYISRQILNYKGAAGRMSEAVERLPAGVDKDILSDQLDAIRAYIDALQAIVDKYSDGSSSVTA